MGQAASMKRWAAQQEKRRRRRLKRWARLVMETNTTKEEAIREAAQILVSDFDAQFLSSDLRAKAGIALMKNFPELFGT